MILAKQFTHDCEPPTRFALGLILLPFPRKSVVFLRCMILLYHANVRIILLFVANEMETGHLRAQVWRREFSVGIAFFRGTGFENDFLD